MSDHLPVLVVPDPDDTTRRVLNALRPAPAAAAANTVTPPDFEAAWLLTWDAPLAVHLATKSQADAAEHPPGYVEGVLSRVPNEPVAAAPSPNGRVVAPLLAFAEAALRARRSDQVYQAAVVVAEQVLEADGVLVLAPGQDGRWAAQAVSRHYQDGPQAAVLDPARWTGFEAPAKATLVATLSEEHLAEQAEGWGSLLDAAPDGAALLLPFGPTETPNGVLVALFYTPPGFDVALKQRGALVTHQVALSLSRFNAEAPSTPPVGNGATPQTSDIDPTPRTSLPSAASSQDERRALPLKALVGLAASAAYGLERSESGTLAVAWATKSLRRLLGADTRLPKTFEDLLASVHPADVGGVRTAFEEVAWGTPTRFDHRLVTEDGESRWVRQAVLRRQQDGREEILGVLLDIDQERAALSRAEEALAEARQRTTGSLLAPLSATFRRPLTELLDQVAAIAHPGSLPDEARIASAQRIVEQGRGMMAALNLMVDLVQLEAGDVDLVRADLRFQDAVEKVLGVLGPLAIRKGLTLDWHPGATSYTLHQDAHAVSRVLHHLVATAIASARSGAIALRIDPNDGDSGEAGTSLTIHVEDYSDATADAPVSNDSVLATPLGGVIAERLVNLMGGQLRRQYVAGGGLRLTLVLPVVSRRVESRRGDALPPVTTAPLPEAAPVQPNASAEERPVHSGAPTSDEPLRSTPLRHHASLEAAAAAMVVAEQVPTETTPQQGVLPSDERQLDTDERQVDTDAPEPEPILAEADRVADAEAETEPALDAQPGDAALSSTWADSDRSEAETPEAERPAPAYARTEVALPVSGIPAFGLRPARKASEPTARSAGGGNLPPSDQHLEPGEHTGPPVARDVPAIGGGASSDGRDVSRDVASLQLGTALDAFAGVEAVPDELEPPHDEVPPTAMEQGRVLVVEDNMETRLLIERLVAREFEVVAVETPRAALEALTRHRFDALVLDINLGGRETGVDVLRIARTLDGYENTFAMAVTAYGKDVDRDRFLSAGFQAYVQKPFEPDALLAPIRAAVAALVDPSS